jgi:hypothetical protein
MSATDPPLQGERQGFRIFRWNDAPDLMSAGCMTIGEYAPVVADGMRKLIDAGFLEGEEIRVLVKIPGFSVAHVWFKADYPLPLHSHDADCLYYIIAGGLQLGAETLGPRDSFFVPAGAAYAYRPGAEGVELLEIRHATTFDFQVFAKNPAFYDKAAAVCEANRERWRDARRPGLNA